MFSKLRPGAQMSVGLLVLFIFLAIGIGLIIQQIEDFQGRADQSLNQDLFIAQHANQMKSAVNGVWQWLTDISATRGMDGLNDGFDEAEKSRKMFFAEISVLEKFFISMGFSAEQEELAKIKSQFAAFYEKGRIMAEGYVRGGPPEGNKMMEAFDGVAESLSNSLDPFVVKSEEKLSVSMKETIEMARLTKSTILWATIPFFAIVGLLGYLLTLTIGRNIRRSLLKVIAGLTDVSHQVTSSANQVASSGQSLASGSSQQAASLEETSSTLEEIASMTIQNAENTTRASTLSEEARQYADKGNEAMSRMGEAINEIKGASDATAKIIKTIDEIAFQTNLLALNAAVEAARAGDAGRGFAVVAEEVRNLALRSAEAAKNTNDMIQTAQNKADTGVSVAREVADVLNEIHSTNQEVASLVAQVAAASDEQSTGITQVNLAMGQMESVTQSNAANAEESAAAGEVLASQARQMLAMVDELIFVVGRSKEGRGKGDMLATLSGNKPRKEIPTREDNHRLEAPSHGGLAKLIRSESTGVIPAVPMDFEGLDDSDFKDM